MPPPIVVPPVTLQAKYDDRRFPPFLSVMAKAIGTTNRGCAIIILVVAIPLIVATVSGVTKSNKEAARQARARATFPSLARTVANLRFFPGYGETDVRPITFDRCTVESVKFSGHKTDTEVSVHITNKTRSGTQPTVEVVLYNADGKVLGSCRPVDFLSRDFEPDGERGMLKSFPPLEEQPAFYALSEPSNATYADPRPIGFDYLCGRVNPPTDVYLYRGANTPPVYAFRIIATAKGANGEQRLVVRDADDGRIFDVDRESVTLDERWLVKVAQ